MELEGNPVSARVLASMNTINMARTPPEPIRVAPIIQVEQRACRHLGPEVGGNVPTKFGASLLVRPNDMLGASDITSSIGTVMAAHCFAAQPTDPRIS